MQASSMEEGNPEELGWVGDPPACLLVVQVGWEGSGCLTWEPLQPAPLDKS